MSESQDAYLSFVNEVAVLTKELKELSKFMADRDEFTSDEVDFIIETMETLRTQITAKLFGIRSLRIK